jgi:hypothetical protein
MNLTRNFNKSKAKKLPPPSKIVGNARNDFGTRLCQRIVCEKCQKVDHVSVRISQKKSQFCRDCAEVFLATYDQGRVLDEKKVNRICGQCARHFMVSEAIALKKSHLLCDDCLRGFDVWRGKIIANNTTTHDRGRSILTKASAKTAFRKNIHENI